MATRPDVLVIGGGIIGLTAALRLRQAGARVSVFDRGELGKEASWAGAGIIPPGNVERAATPIDKLRAIGSVQLPGFSHELQERVGLDNGYRRNGGIEFLTKNDEYAIELWQAEGIRHEKLDGSQLDELESQVRVIQAIPYHLPDMAQVRNPWHLRGLIALCQIHGVALQPLQGIENWHIVDGRVRGVRLHSGETLTAASLVLAAGPWSERLLADLGCRPGVRPVRGQILLLNTRTDVTRTLIFGKRYLVPRGDGRVLVGSTEEPEAGFAKQTTTEGLAELQAFAETVVPALADAEREAGWAGLRPGSPDGLPFIGPVPGHENVIAAVGHHRAGVQLSLGTAQFVTELVLGQPTCVPVHAFALDRRPNLRAKPAFRS